ncbi:hypothetical protein H2200_010200 [Cladophialophora chaetospira]|uniref:Uncharacterized protein n=1 Tax=Cladophialophora chaetospira TaxID=386627 RepID=A0AA39CEP5_9EURO|nr:hypothetical protein H2200_010200 [Cladophialophora chaetospira]
MSSSRRADSRSALQGSSSQEEASRYTPPQAQYYLPTSNAPYALGSHPGATPMFGSATNDLDGYGRYSAYLSAETGQGVPNNQYQDQLAYEIAPAYGEGVTQASGRPSLDDYLHPDFWNNMSPPDLLMREPAAPTEKGQIAEDAQYTYSNGSTASPAATEINASLSSATTPANSMCNTDQANHDANNTSKTSKHGSQPSNPRARRGRNAPKAANPRRPKKKILNGGDIPGLLSHKQPLPAHVKGLVEICRDFPNHLRGELLDEFLFYGWSYIDIWNNVTDSTIDGWLSIGVIDEETLLKGGHLSNRVRSRQRFYKAKGFTKDQMLNMPKRFISEVGFRKGLKSFTKGPTTSNDEFPDDEEEADETSTVDEEEADETSFDEEESHNHQVAPNVEAADEQISPEATISEEEIAMDFVQTDELPFGSFCGMAFWIAEGEFDRLLNMFMKTMKDVEPNATEIIAGNVDLLGVDASVKLDAKLALLGWGEESREDYIAAVELAKSKKGGNAKVDREAFMPDVYVAMLKEEAYKCLDKMPEASNKLQKGVFDQRLVATLREEVIKGFVGRMSTVRRSVRRQHAELKRKRLQAARSITNNTDVAAGQKRQREDEEDAETIKKARLDETPTPLGEVVMQEGAVDAVLATEASPPGNDDSNGVGMARGGHDTMFSAPSLPELPVVDANDTIFSLPPLPTLPADDMFSLAPLPEWQADEIFASTDIDHGLFNLNTSRETTDAQAYCNLPEYEDPFADD